MSDQGTVSTEDTLEPRNQMVVTTEENQAAEPPQQNAEPPAEGESQTSDASATSDKTDSAEKPKRDRRSERTIRRLKKENAELRKELDSDRERLGSLERTVDELKAAQSPKEPPKRADFETDEEFGEAYMAFKSESASPAEQPQTQPQQDSVTPPEDPFEEERTTLMRSGQEKYGDEFAEAMQSTADPVPVSLDMRDFIFEDPEVGADVFMYLDEHRDEARKIYGMGSAAAEKALTKIAKKVKESPPERSGEISEPEGAGGSESETQQQQPQVPETVRTSASPVEKDPADMSMEEYADYRRARENRRH